MDGRYKKFKNNIKFFILNIILPKLTNIFIFCSVFFYIIRIIFCFIKNIIVTIYIINIYIHSYQLMVNMENLYTYFIVFIKLLFICLYIFYSLL